MKKFRLEDVQLNAMIASNGDHVVHAIYKPTGHGSESVGYSTLTKNEQVATDRLRTTLEEAGIVSKETRINKPQVKTLLTMSKLILLCQEIDKDDNDLRGISYQLNDSVNQLIKSVDLEVDNKSTPNLEQGVIDDVVGVIVDAVRVYVNLYAGRSEIPNGPIGLLTGLFNTLDSHILALENKK